MMCSNPKSAALSPSVFNRKVRRELSLARLFRVRVVAPKVIGTDLFNRRIHVATEMLNGLQVRVNSGSSVVAAYELFS
ncbi:MAG TPA: hypothetical protein VMT86_19910, partial [Bryobacteraceae bacterium]|nr:hypothetical protein [Bryobacteraceae bacterium]